MEPDADMIPSSPSNSSPSSSDLDTESTGSFFPDRSTTLGTLMGVSLADGHHRPHRGPASAQSRRDAGEEGRRPLQAAAPEGRRGRRLRRRGRSGGSWWRLCREDIGGPTSLGEFLDLERQLPGGAGQAAGEFLCAEHEALFEDGRVRPPAAPEPAPAAEERGRWRLQRAAGSSAARLPVLLAGICSGGAG